MWRCGRSIYPPRFDPLYLLGTNHVTSDNAGQMVSPNPKFAYALQPPKKERSKAGLRLLLYYPSFDLFLNLVLPTAESGAAFALRLFYDKYYNAT